MLRYAEADRIRRGEGTRAAGHVEEGRRAKRGGRRLEVVAEGRHEIKQREVAAEAGGGGGGLCARAGKRVPVFGLVPLKFTRFTRGRDIFHNTGVSWSGGYPIFFLQRLAARKQVSFKFRRRLSKTSLAENR